MIVEKSSSERVNLIHLQGGHDGRPERLKRYFQSASCDELETLEDWFGE